MCGRRPESLSADSCRDRSTPCRKRRATLIVMKNQEGTGLQTGHHKG